MTFRDAKALGYRITILRQYMNGLAGWSYEVTFNGEWLGDGWTVGFGPRAKSQAMRDALAAVDKFAVLRASSASSRVVA